MIRPKVPSPMIAAKWARLKAGSLPERTDHGRQQNEGQDNAWIPLPFIPLAEILTQRSTAR
jgi:hypothetical protein